MKYTYRNMCEWAKLASRRIVGVPLYEVLPQNDKAVVCYADVSSRFGLDEIQKEFPERCVQVGIAEQALVGMASGLFHEGFTPFAIAYAPFITARVMDQLRGSVGAMGLGIKMVGAMGGLSAGELGPMSVALEDIAAVRSIPNITIISPADNTEAVKALMAISKLDTPVYLRLSGSTHLPMPMVYKEDYSFKVGKAVEMAEGKDVTIIATGTMVYHAMRAREQLLQGGISCAVVNMHTIKPIDKAAIGRHIGSKLFVTVEEHNVVGGLGSAVAEQLSALCEAPPLLRLGVDDTYYSADVYAHLLDKAGISAEKIAAAIEKAL